jgi:acyl-CoA synthetase (AMP-forming)/AMP-acid ligase II
MSGVHEPRLVELVRTRAEATPQGVAYEFVDEDGHVETLTYAELAERATGRARALLRQRPAGADGPALILYPPGLDYVVALFACLLARVPAAPAYPPDPWRPEVGLERLGRIVEDARPASVLTAPFLAPVLELAGAAGLASAAVADDGDGDGPDLPAGWLAGGMDTAVVQYTSGSTRSPRGVVVRHRNLEHNIPAIVEAFRVDEGSRGFIWLPPYHDMGLVGGILTPIWVGFPVRLMSPLDFLKRPFSWLKQMSETRATASGGPNFAYDLCVRRRPPDEDLAELDLSSWSVAFNGAEPIRWRTMKAFAEAFAPAGFRRSAFFPCYGLAEATLIVTGRHWDGTVLRGTRRERVEELEPGAEAEPVRVSCGPPIPGARLLAVDPDRQEPLAEGAEGEIWIHGPSVTTEYWSTGDPDVFAEWQGLPFLRTGDLGYLADGELVVTGRLKDVVVFRGVNYHAADIEQAAVSAMPGLRQIAAAFGVEKEDETLAVIVVEARPAAGEPETVAATVRTRVVEATALALHAVVVSPPGTIPRTSSGKVQRSLCREQFLSGRLEGALAYADDAAAGLLGGRGAAPGEPVEGLLELVCGVFAAVCGAERCGSDDTLFELGGDSVRAAEIAGVLEGALQVPVAVVTVLEALTPANLSRRVLDLWTAEHGDTRLLAERLRALAATVEPARA